ncbi:MAG: peptide ABC transporter permease [Gammaproteobacteria bacterium SG8_11]|nr:MAG: peptide ABC transporter permease [Gammaproteobacteria bacterium SG8_11]
MVIALIVAASLGIASATNVRIAVLWSDALIYLLVLAIAAFAIEATHKEHLRAPWRHVARRPLAMSALVVLLLYVVVGLLDSVHFRQALEPQEGQTEIHYSGEELSLLDVILTPLREQQEKTYSAPFATHLYMKETLERDGIQIRDYPRLTHAGSHLDDPEKDKVADIVLKTLLALIEALILWAVILIVLAALLARGKQLTTGNVVKAILRNNTEIPWLAMLVTFGMMLLLIMFTVNLAGSYHILGTDKVGQDVLYLAIKSIRTGLVIVTLTTLIMLPFAIMLGIMAGHFKGWVDDVIQYLYTTLNSIPGVLLIAAAILSMQVYMANHPEMFETVTQRADVRLVFLCMILGITSWTGLCRLLRGETLKLSQLDYVEAATAFGVGHFKIMTRHILPNVMHIVLIAVVLDFSALVLAEAVLSYVGVGVDPVTISWGNMINSARLEMARDPVVWWSLVAAFVFMFALVLAANLFSDAVRDAFDPRISRTK